MSADRRCPLVVPSEDPSQVSDNDWSESSINSDSAESCISGSESECSIPEWESSVDRNTGELIYIDCHPFVTQNSVDSTKPNQSNILKSHRLSNRKSFRRNSGGGGGGKFLRILKRRESKRKNRTDNIQHPDVSTSTGKVKFHDTQQGEEREVLLKVQSGNARKNYSNSNSNLCELLLGLSISTLSDGKRVMIAGFVPNSPAKYEKHIKIGDWLKSINNINVTYHDINQVLQRMDRSSTDEVLLKLQRVAGMEVTKNPPMNELNCQSRFVGELKPSSKDDLLSAVLSSYATGISYISCKKINGVVLDYETIYCYPSQSCILNTARGMFVTLNELLHDVTNTKPKLTTFLFKGQLCHAVYSHFEGSVLLFMTPENCANMYEALLFSDEIIRMLQFTCENVNNCFTNSKYLKSINNLFGRICIKLLNIGWTSKEQFIENHNSRNIPQLVKRSQFERILPAAPVLNLPNEAIMQIDEALTELEACDYREWNDDPLDCQRLFTFLGSAFYHHGQLLVSHFNYADLMEVNTLCRQEGLLYLSQTEPIKTLVLWRECFPASCRRNALFRTCKYYLLIVASGTDLLAIIMEAGGCTEPPKENMCPNAFYVDEAQNTLRMIQELGLSELADKWMTMNPGPEVTVPECSTRQRSDLLNLVKLKKSKETEVISILKHRACEQTLLYPDHSDDDLSESNSDSRSDDPNSDETYSNDSCEVSELKQALLNEVENIQLQQIAAGPENCLFHYVQLDTAKGVIICPPDCRLQSPTYECILDNFRKCCQKISALFLNTIKFKDMPVQSMATSVMNRSLIAIKEHGILFECASVNDGDKKKLRYWVTGRLMHTPDTKQVYVCYQNNTPQNILELAYRININNLMY